jgi:hypothetical protein
MIILKCEKWSHCYGEHSLKGFENRVLRRMSVPWKEEVAVVRKFHNEKLHNLYSSHSIIRRNAYKILVINSKGRFRHMRRLILRWILEP